MTIITNTTDSVSIKVIGKSTDSGTQININTIANTKTNTNTVKQLEGDIKNNTDNVLPADANAIVPNIKKVILYRQTRNQTGVLLIAMNGRSVRPSSSVTQHIIGANRYRHIHITLFLSLTSSLPI